MLAHLLIDLVWYMVVGDQCQRFCPEEGRPFPLSIEWRFFPGRKRVKALFTFTVGSRVLGMNIEAIGAPVDL